MKRFSSGLIYGMIFGGSLVAAFAFGLAQASNTSRSDLEEVGEPSVHSIEAGNCKVAVGYGRMTYGDRCFRGEVMVGARDGYLYCSDIQVTCD